MRFNQLKANQLIAALLVCVVIASGAIALVYSVYVSRSDAKIVRALGGRLPVASVGGKAIPYSDFLDARDTIKIYFASDAAKKEGFAQAVTPQVEKDALDRLVRQVATQEMAKQKSVEVKDEDVAQAFEQLVISTSTTMPNVSQYLKNTFGWTEKEFQEKVIRPSLLEQKIASAYASGTTDAAAAYEKDIQDRLAKPDVKYYLKIDTSSVTTTASATP